VNFTAFLGGISANYNSNYIQKSDGESLVIDGVKKEIIVLEADEFDRSFHRLTPDLAVITAMDPDHLDIYGTEEEFREAFNVFAQLIHAGDVQTSKQLSPRGAGLVLNEKLSKQIVSPQGVELITYGERLESDIHYQQVTITNSNYHFDYCESSQTKVEFQCGLPGFHNIENACAALAITHYFLQLPIEKLQEGIQSFKGAKRRFEYIVRNDNYIVIDDYAHHPEELNAIIRSVKALYPQRPLTGIFQPHLFSRTRDFVDGFADSLSQLDECWLMEIYPAREQPMEGVNSHWLSEKIHTKTTVLNGDQILERLTQEPKELLLILGAGDIDKLVTPIKNIYSVL
jgi:UDP-N-acetylmuramate--alanine ligase